MTRKKVRAILDHMHELKERRYVGNMDAVDELLDFDSALNLAGLNAQQKFTLDLVFFQGLKQDDAATVLGVSKQRVSKIVRLIEEKLAEVYEYWTYKDELEAIYE